MTRKTYTLGFSPCPNDTFIFDALVHGRIETHDLTPEVTLADVETLNRWAAEGKLDVTKLSYHAYAHVCNEYIMLDSGSALGRNCGPLVITADIKSLNRKPRSEWKVAIPGNRTTAHFLFSLAYPEVITKEEMVFSDIEDAVVKGSVDAGVIIHENRFTYAEKGLEKLSDLGEFWEESTGMPIPLGGIAARRSLGKEVLMQIRNAIRDSVDYAMEHPADCNPYVRLHAQEMSETVQRQHIALYVNDFSRELGPEGRRAVEHMFGKGNELGLWSPCEELFIP